MDCGAAPQTVVGFGVAGELDESRRRRSDASCVLLSAEFAVLLFLFSGIYKALPGLRSIPVDLTLLSGLWLVGVCLAEIVRRSPRWGPGTLAATGLVVLWLTFTATSYLWSSGAEIGWDRLTRGLPLVFLAFVGAALFVGPFPTRMERLLGLLPWFSVLAVLGTVQALAASIVPTPGDRLQSSYIDRGISLSLGIMILLAQAIHATSVAKRILSLVLAALFGAAIIAAGSRQALAASALGGVLVVLAALHAGRVRGAIIGSALAVGLVVTISTALASAGVDLGTLRRLAVALQSSGGGASLGARGGHALKVVTHFGDAPVLGHGLGSFGYLYGDIPGDYPHNIVLEVAFETGLVGLLLLGTVAVMLLLRARESSIALSPAHRLGFVLVLAVVGVNIMVSTSYTSNRLFFGVLGLCVAGVTGQRRMADPRQLDQPLQAR